GHAECESFTPRLRTQLGRGPRRVAAQRHEVVRLGLGPEGGALWEGHERRVPIFGLLAPDPRDPDAPGRDVRLAMDPGAVEGIVLQRTEDVHRPGRWVRVVLADSLFIVLELRETRKVGRLPFAQVREHEAEVVLGRIRANSDPAAKWLGLGGLLGALSVGTVLPAVIEAADLVSLDPAGRELRTSMGAAERDRVSVTALTAVEGEVLAGDTDGLGSPGDQILRAMDGDPETPQVAARQRPWPGPPEFHPFSCGRAVLVGHPTHPVNWFLSRAPGRSGCFSP